VNDRPTENGDEVVLDFAGFVDGVQFEGGTAEMQTLTLGSGQFIPGFDEQLLDKVPGEEVIVEVTFPTDYRVEELAGKPAQFRCKIHKIRIKTTYELNDEFAKEVGGCETMEEMRTKLQESMQQYSDERGEMDLQERLLQQASETLEFTPDPNELEDAVEQHLRNMEAQLSQKGLSLDMYCSFMGITRQQLHDESYPAAEANLRRIATVAEIVRLENLTVSEQEMEDAIALICQRNNMTREQFQGYYDAEFEAAVRRTVQTTKVMMLIRDSANITEK
jgi:trigger factor